MNIIVLTANHDDTVRNHPHHVRICRFLSVSFSYKQNNSGFRLCEDVIVVSGHHEGQSDVMCLSFVLMTGTRAASGPQTATEKDTFLFFESKAVISWSFSVRRRSAGCRPVTTFKPASLLCSLLVQCKRPVVNIFSSSGFSLGQERAVMSSQLKPVSQDIESIYFKISSSTNDYLWRHTWNILIDLHWKYFN